MARVVKIEDKRPVQIEVGGEVKHICMCGLSKKKPLCDGSHRQCVDEEEGKTYEYNESGREEV